MSANEDDDEISAMVRLFAFTERGAFSSAIGEMLVQTFHERDGECVVSEPKSRDDGPRTGDKKGTFEAGKSSLAK